MDRTPTAARIRPPPLIAIPGGKFVMGRDDRRPDERPARTVRVSPFRAAPRPVCNAEYAVFMAHSEARPPRFFEEPRFNQAEQPVVGVSWHEALAYCAWLAQASGIPLRLPSEAEREFAALGGRAGGDWPWGEIEPERYAPLAFVAEASGPHIPRAACANGYGLRCMAENVHEWCANLYTAGAEGTTDASCPADDDRRRASRGGSWRHRVKFTRVSARSSLRPSARYNDYGFRLYAPG